ncbi:DUF3488 and transglutaminase-like domain-containing protein [Cellulomonas timonensis]|uniref:DUF3488 and transglutaminase-like domain-containing protein n=1 Tax=Cellulomonas timonensis TaxID=1689271 RepID=UPI0008366874|nr:DUF3488 and transglutaminase-like domain-containing protein [Cellulomonas timonensis]
MRGPREEPVALRGARGLLASALVGTATCGGLLAVRQLIAPGSWLGAALLVVILLTALTAGVRAVSRRWWAPTVVGALATMVGVLIAFGAPPGALRLLPDMDSVDRLIAMTRVALDLVNSSFVPLQSSRPIVLLVVVGAALLLLGVDLVALGLGAPAWSGLVLLIVWIPGIVLGTPASGLALAVPAVPSLRLLALSVAPATAGPGTARRAGWTVAAAGGIAAVAIVVGPLVAPVPGWAALELPRWGSGSVGPVRLNDSLDMRDSLGPRSEQIVLRYTVEEASDSAPAADTSGLARPTLLADAKTIGPLRAFTMRDFDGRTWARGDSTDLETWDPETLLSPDPSTHGDAPDPSEGLLASVHVVVGGLREDRLPVSTFARTLDIAGEWFYDAENDQVVGDRSTRNGLGYSMTVQVPELTADTLRASSPASAPALDPYLTVPDTEHAQDVADLAAEVAAGATGAFEQAMALQTWFRNPQNFVYDTRVEPATSSDSVWDFLESKRGYCVQYATSMAIMARTLGIPARVGVGFLPGTLAADDEYVITGRQSHAWPELYFPSAGWVRFEPTPAVQTGTPPRWSDPLVVTPATAAPTAEPVAPSAPAPTASSTTAPRAAVPAPDVDEAEIPRALVAPVAGILLALLLGAVVMLRRRAARVSHLTAEDAWGWLRGRLRRAHITWSDARTPRQAAALIRARAEQLRGEPLDDAADDALTRLTEAVERGRYAPHPTQEPTDDVRQWAHAVLEGVRSGLDRGSPAERLEADAGGTGRAG